MLIASLAFLVAGVNPPAITVEVDATTAPRNFLRTTMTLPAHSGRNVYVYPKWIPGNHGPTGPIGNMVDLHFTSGGKELVWRRDDVDMFAFRVEVPTGAKQITASFTNVAATGAGTSPVSAFINFNQLVLYPHNSRSDDLVTAASIRFPVGWQYATALHGTAAEGKTTFEPVSLTKLVDSPILTGRYFKKQVLATGDGPVHEIDMAGDNAECIQMPAETAAAYAKLVGQARTLFGATHYGEYHWLVPVSSTLRGRGLEHHECSEDGASVRVFKDDSARVGFAGLLAHEYAHSWCGKYRRPIGLATKNYQDPMKGELLYVYEGMTQFLGTILPARAGLWSKDELLANLASTAANLDHRPGREWRNLQDTAISSQFVRQGDEYSTIRRQQDYYQEAVLIWLEADAIIRTQSHGKKSIDDFCHAFFGGPSTGPVIKPYDFEEFVRTLSGVQAYDWRTFLRIRLDGHDAHAPLGGFAASGWSLEYRDTPMPGARGGEPDYNLALGLTIGEGGTIGSVTFRSISFNAGLVGGEKLLEVNGETFTSSVFKRAVAAKKPLELLVSNGFEKRIVKLDYIGGLKYPWLVRIEGKPDLLSDLVAAH